MWARKDDTTDDTTEAAGEEALVLGPSTGNCTQSRLGHARSHVIVQVWLLTVLQSSYSFLILLASQTPGWLQ